MIPNEDIIAEFMRAEKTAAEIAKSLHVSEKTLSDWVKIPMTDERKARIIEAIRG